MKPWARGGQCEGLCGACIRLHPASPLCLVCPVAALSCKASVLLPAIIIFGE